MAHLWLIGMMGSGKTAVGEMIAARLDRKFIDTDARVAERVGCSVAELWGERGEEAFRDMEAAQITAAAAESPAVIATGGGAVLRASSRTVMRASGRVMWLRATPAVILERLNGDTTRPLLEVADPARALTELDGRRAEYYDRAAHGEITTDGLTAAEVADLVFAWWNDS